LLRRDVEQSIKGKPIARKSTAIYKGKRERGVWSSPIALLAKGSDTEERKKKVRKRKREEEEDTSS